MMNTARRLGSVVLGALLSLPLAMCGGAAPMPAQSPGEASPSGATAAPESNAATPAPGYPAAAPPPAQPAATSSGDMQDAPSRRAAARAELAQAQAELQAAASDCTAACRALASMERATQHLCELAEDPDDQGRCNDARQRLLAARERVRSACGTCP